MAVHVHPAEKVEILDVTHPNTELFNKIMATFTTLCDEINELCLMARGRYLPALALFGRQLDEDEWDSKPGALEVEMGRMLPMLQQVGNFAERCNALVLNLVQQVRAACSLARPGFCVLRIRGFVRAPNPAWYGRLCSCHRCTRLGGTCTSVCTRMCSSFQCTRASPICSRYVGHASVFVPCGTPQADRSPPPPLADIDHHRPRCAREPRAGHGVGEVQEPHAARGRDAGCVR